MLAALATALALTTAHVTAVRVEEQGSTATVSIQVVGSARHRTAYWTGKPNLLVIDVHPARLAIAPGEAYRGKAVRVRAGQWQSRTVRVVVETPHAAVYSTSATKGWVLVRIRLPALSAHTEQAPPQARAPERPAPPQQNPAFAIFVRGTLAQAAATISALSGRTIRVHPDIADRPVSLNMPSATLRQALDALARQAGGRWLVLPGGTIEIRP